MPEQLSKEQVEALREMAANRGCRLVRSRRRKPGGDYGRMGLADLKSGKEVFGFGKKGLEATPGEIESFLRGSITSTWKKSLAAAGKGGVPRPAAAPRKKAASTPLPKPGPRAAARPEPRPKRSKPEPAEPIRAAPAPAPPPEPPALRIRRADSVDGEAVAALLAELGEKASADAVSDGIARLSRAGESVLLSKLGAEVAGFVAFHALPLLHRPEPLGRITLLAVASKARRRGIGAELLRAAERRLFERGCRRVELAAPPRSAAAKKFAKASGYEAAADLFARPIGA